MTTVPGVPLSQELVGGHEDARPVDDGEHGGVLTREPPPPFETTEGEGTDSGLVALQNAIEASLAKATPLTNKLFGRSAWSADQVQRFVNRTMTATIATVRPDGQPHAAWVLAACLRGTIYFSVTKESVLLRNLNRGSGVALTVTDARHGLMAEGGAILVGRSLDVPDLVKALDAAVVRGRLLPRGWDGYVYSVEIRRIFAN